MVHDWYDGYVYGIQYDPRKFSLSDYRFVRKMFNKHFRFSKLDVVYVMSSYFKITNRDDDKSINNSQFSTENIERIFDKIPYDNFTNIELEEWNKLKSMIPIIGFEGWFKINEFD